MLKLRQWYAIIGLKSVNVYANLPKVWHIVLLPVYIVWTILFNMGEITLYAIQTVGDVLRGETTFKKAYKDYVTGWASGYNAIKR